MGLPGFKAAGPGQVDVAHAVSTQQIGLDLGDGIGHAVNVLAYEGFEYLPLSVVHARPGKATGRLRVPHRIVRHLRSGQPVRLLPALLYIPLIHRDDVPGRNGRDQCAVPLVLVQGAYQFPCQVFHVAQGPEVSYPVEGRRRRICPEEEGRRRDDPSPGDRIVDGNVVSLEFPSPGVTVRWRAEYGHVVVGRIPPVAR